MTDWYCKIRDRRYGPMTSGKLKRLAASGELGPQDLVRREGDRKWARASSVRGLFVPRKPESESEASVKDACSSPAEARQRESGWCPSSKDLVGLVAMSLSLTLLVGSIWYTFGRSTRDSFAPGGGIVSGHDSRATTVPSAEVSEPAGVGPAAAFLEPPEASACSEDLSLSEEGEEGEVASAAEELPGAEADLARQTPADLTEELGTEQPRLESRSGGDEASPPREHLAGGESILDPVVEEPPIPGVSEAEGKRSGERAGAVKSARPQESVRANELFEAPRVAARFPATFPKDQPRIPEEPAADAAVPEQQPEAPAVPCGQSERYRERLEQLFSRTRSRLAETAVAQKELYKVQSEIQRSQAALQESMLRMSALASQIQELQFEINKPRISVQMRNQLRNRAQMLLEQLQAMVAIKENTEQQLERVLPVWLAEANGKMVETEKKNDVLLPEWIASSDPLGNQSVAVHGILSEASSRWLVENIEFLPAYLMRGVAHWHRGDEENALSDLNRVVEWAAGGGNTAHQREVLAVAHAIRAVMQAEREQEALARADIAKATEFYPNSVVVCLLRGRTHVALGRSRAARDDFLRATRLDSQEPTGFRKLAWLLASTPASGSGQRATYYGRIACELTDWNQWQSLDAYALANAAEGNFERAIEMGQRARDAAPPEVRPAVQQRLELYQAGVAPVQVRQR